MRLTEQTSNGCETLPVDGTTAVRLRIRGQGTEQLVDLPLGKTTVGSSPRCNVRIQQSAVHPLQFLLTREPSGMTVRSWAAGTLLNGEPFVETSLDIGDTISVGPIRWEIFAAGTDKLDPSRRANTGLYAARRLGRRLSAKLTPIPSDD